MTENELWSHLKPQNKSLDSANECGDVDCWRMSGARQTNRPPNVKVTRLTRRDSTRPDKVAQLAEKRARQRVKWPKDANNLGDGGRPALINATLAVRGSLQGRSPWILPRGCPRHHPAATPITPPREACSPPLTPSSTPSHDNERTAYEGKGRP